MARFLFVVPAAVEKRTGGPEEMASRKAYLQRLTDVEHSIDISDVPDAPAHLNTAEAAQRSVDATVQRLVRAQGEGYDVGIIACMANPGLDQARRVLRMPVVGAADATFRAAGAGKRPFAVLTPYAGEDRATLVESLVDNAGVADSFAGAFTIDPPPRTALIDALTAEGRRAIEEGTARCLVLGAMQWSFRGMAEILTAELGTPVLNSVKCALRATREEPESQA